MKRARRIYYVLLYSLLGFYVIRQLLYWLTPELPIGFAWTFAYAVSILLLGAGVLVEALRALASRFRNKLALFTAVGSTCLILLMTTQRLPISGYVYYFAKQGALNDLVANLERTGGVDYFVPYGERHGFLNGKTYADSAAQWGIYRPDSIASTFEELVAGEGIDSQAMVDIRNTMLGCNLRLAQVEDGYIRLELGKGHLDLVTLGLFYFPDLKPEGFLDTIGLADEEAKGWFKMYRINDHWHYWWALDSP